MNIFLEHGLLLLYLEYQISITNAVYWIGKKKDIEMLGAGNRHYIYGILTTNLSIYD